MVSRLLLLYAHNAPPPQGEKFNLPVDGRDVSGQYDPSAHGTKGFIGVSVPGAPRGIDDRVMATTKELPEEFPFQKDMNAGNQVGVGARTSCSMFTTLLSHKCI